jgi:hypothetical protein
LTGNKKSFLSFKGFHFPFLANLTIENDKLSPVKGRNSSQLLHLKVEEPTGVYFLKIESGDKEVIIRLVKD